MRSAPLAIRQGRRRSSSSSLGGGVLARVSFETETVADRGELDADGVAGIVVAGGNDVRIRRTASHCVNLVTDNLGQELLEIGKLLRIVRECVHLLFVVCFSFCECLVFSDLLMLGSVIVIATQINIGVFIISASISNY